jgi:CHAT domain-containing protein
MTNPAPPMRVGPDQPQKRQLTEGEVHPYFVRLEAGEYVRIIAEQRGVDLLLRLFAPGGTQPLVEVDSPTGTRGFERVVEIAEVAGDYRVDVIGGEATPAGEYEIRIEERRAATEADHKRVEGERMFLVGDGLRRAGKLKEALARYERALGLWQEAGDQVREADALARIGWMYERLDRWREAVDLWTQAASLYRQAGDETEQASTLNRAGRLLVRLNRSEEALSLLEEAARLFRATSDLDGEASALNNLGNIHDLAGRFQEAVEAYEKASSMWRQLGNRLGLSIAHYGMAQALLHKEDVDGALHEIEESFSLAEHQRTGTGELDFRPSYFAIQQRSWDLYIDILRQLDRLHPNQGFAARSLEAEALAEIQRQLLDTDTLLLVYSLDKERSVLWKVTRSTLISYQLPSREQIETAAELAYDALSHRLRSGPGLQQKVVDDLAALILEPVARALPKFRRLLIVPNGALHRIPFGALPDLGVASREGRQPPLAQGHPIVYLPSASMGATLRQERRSGQLRQRSGPLVAVLADPVFDASDPRVRQSGSPPPSKSAPTLDSLAYVLPDLGIVRLERLPFSREEALAIQELRYRSGDVLPVLGFDANRQVLNDERWRRAPILHFATHALMDDRQSELSGLVFSQVNPDGTPRTDGFLRLQEIAGLDLEADLVVLSACHAGTGKELRGEGLVGLSQGFMSIGVPQLVVSLWKVEGQATKELMRHFYKELFNGYRPPEALQRAQKAMLQQEAWSDPSLWAGFIFIGDFERWPGGGIEVRDTGGIEPVRRADGAGLPPPKIKPKPPKR